MLTTKKRLGPVRVTARAAEVYAEYASLPLGDAVLHLEHLLRDAGETSEAGKWRYRRKSDRLDITARVETVHGTPTVVAIAVRGYSFVGDRKSVV